MYAGDDQRYGGYGSQGNRGGSGGYGESGYGEGGYESRRGGGGGGGGGYGGRGGDRRSSGYDRRDDGGRGGGGDRESYGGGGGRGFGGGQRGGDCRSGFDGGNYGGTQEHDMPDTIFITGMPEDVTEDQIEEHFGAIGVIKTDKKTRKKKIWIYKDKESGRGKGEATVTYDDPPTASSAIAWFDNKEFMGQTIKVQVAQRKSTWVPPQKGGRGRGRGGGGGGFRGAEDRGGRDGDWPCDSCGNKNFSWRNSCNRCDTPKPGSGGGGGGGKDRGDRGGGGGGGYNRHRPY